ncbi:MAG TPA: sigma-70 family RNA polymerase sigma factor [Actinomycetota bacterium]|nr:sigma-70 family RNA polymerase sigma factor [Actinomycetota bacterium]
MKVSVDEGVELLYREHGQRLWRAVMAFTGDREVASDAVAEAFAQALRRGDVINDPLRWVWRAAFRIAAGELKERGRFREASTDRGYDQDEPVTDLLEALAKLSPKQRAAVLLHHHAGYPVKEVADIIGSTTAAVKVHLMRGRNRLRDLLGEEHD